MGRINPLLAIGIPSWGTVSLDWSRAYRHLSGMLGSTMIEIPIEGQPIAAARNYLMAQAIANRADFLFMLGDDVLPPGDSIIRLWQRMQDHPEIDLITGVYWTKGWPSHPYLWRGLQRGPFLDWKAGEFLPVEYAGCDCLMIRLSPRMVELGPEWFATDWLWEADQAGPDFSLNTEDFYFYTKARRAGIELWADTEVQCGHQDRTTRAIFGLTEAMPQAGGMLPDLPEAGTDAAPVVTIADIGAGLDTPFFGQENVQIVRFDGDVAVRPDYRCDLRRLPVADGAFDVVHSRHALEHFGRAEVPAVVKEWLRVLRVGGELRLSVPNLAYAMERVLAFEAGTAPYDPYAGWQLYGQQATPYDYHRIGFTPRILREFLEALGGLTDIRVEVDGDQGQNIAVTARKTAAPERFALVPQWDAIMAEAGVAVEGLNAPEPVVDMTSGMVDGAADAVVQAAAKRDCCNTADGEWHKSWCRIYFAFSEQIKPHRDDAYQASIRARIPNGASDESDPNHPSERQGAELAAALAAEQTS